MTKFIKIEDKPPTLEEAQAFVGGTVQLLMIYEEDEPDDTTMFVNENDTQMIVNEDGVRLRLPLNEEASMYYGEPIVGPAMVLSGAALWD